MTRSKHFRTTPALAALALSLAAGAASAQVVADTFTRTTGNPDPTAGPIVSDWGSAELPSSASYVESVPGTEFDVEYVAEGTARLNFGRVILDYNLGTDAAIAAAQGVVVTVDVNPADNGDASGVGRDWGGIVLGDSNSPTTVGGSGYLTASGNQSARVGYAPRNSGSGITRLGPSTIRANGNPNAANFNEDVIDSDTFADYQAYLVGRDANDPQDFESSDVYTVRLTVTPAAGNTLFQANSAQNARLEVAVNGGAFDRVDFNTSTPEFEETFNWGASSNAYLVFVGNTGEHTFDNLSIAAIPEPTSLGLLGVAGLGLLRRRRVS